jgi:hypothetical protein
MTIAIVVVVIYCCCCVIVVSFNTICTFYLIPYITIYSYIHMSRSQKGKVKGEKPSGQTTRGSMAMNAGQGGRHGGGVDSSAASSAGRSSPSSHHRKEDMPAQPSTLDR